MNTLQSKAAMIAALQIFGASAAHAVDYTYDALGRLRVETFANNAHILHSYDALGNRTERRVIPPNPTPNADLLTTLTLSPDPAAQGLPVTATLTVQNLGPDPAPDVEVTSALPAAFLPGSATASQGSAALAGQNLSATLGTIPAGETVTVTVLGTADGTANFLVEATATSPADSTPGNNTGSDNTTPAASANLALLRLHSGPQPLLSTGTALLAFTARNDGPATATGVEAEVVLPPQFTFVNAIGGTGSSAAGQTITVTLADLAPGTETLIFVFATPTATGDLTTAVTLSATQADPDPTNNADSVVSNVLAPTLTVTNNNDSGAGSLRQAILDANANPDADRIAFAIPGATVPTLAPTTPLPAITQPVLIDGWSQPQFAVEINGAGQGANTDVFTVTGSDVTLRALTINRGPRDGILVSSGDFQNRSDNIQIFACNVGVDPGGTLDLGNSGDGIQVTFANRVVIGGPETWQSCVISGNSGDGISVTSGSGHVIQGNRIGTDVNGTTAIFNGSEGISFGGSNSLIGGTEFGEGNLSSGNRAEGVQLDGSRNRMFGNLVGTDINGTARLPNGTGFTTNSQAGVVAAGFENQIGGPEFAQRNIISGNQVENVRMQNRCLVIGNYIGLDITGTQAIGSFDPNAVGVRFNFSSATSPCVLGGVLPGHGNIISGNASNGVSYNLGNVRGAAVLGNLIGTSADGKTAVPNGANGIVCRSTDVDANILIGGTLSGSGNLISGNTLSGIRFLNNGGTPARSYLIQGNRIGVASDGSPLGNGTHGIHAESAQDNTIGGTEAGAGNLIAHNTADGIAVITSPSLGAAPALRNSILGNAIHSNGGLGIDLADDGVTVNDALDADDGPNALQNFPVVTLANATGGSLAGTLNAAPSSTFRVEFFSSPSADPSGHGEGADFLGHIEVTTDANGDAGIALTTAIPMVAGHFVTATATSSDGATSEFGEAEEVVAPPDDEAPTILTAPANRELTADPDGFASLPDLTGEVVATDNVGVFSITQNPAAGTRLPIGDNNVVMTVSDVAGNFDTAPVVIAVVAEPVEVVVNTLFVTRETAGDPLGQVPGEPVGTIFTRIGVPMLDGDDVGFLASIKAPDARLPLAAIIGGNPSSVLVRAGDAAPGTNGAALLRLRDPLFSGGKLSFLAHLRRRTGDPVTRGNSDTGIWSELNGPLALVAREGGDAADVADGKFARFIALDASPDSVVFLAQLRFGNGVSPRNHIGLWRHTDTGTDLLMRRGDDVEIGPGDTRRVASIFMGPPVRFSADQARSFSAAGEFRVLVRFTDRSRAVCVFPLVGPAFVDALSRDEVLDPAGESILVPGVPSSGAVGVAFQARMVRRIPDVTPLTDQGVFLGDENGFAIQSRERGTAPDTGDALFSFFSDPILSGDDAVTFVGRLLPGTGDPRTRANSDFGIWTSANDGMLKLLAREGDPAPGVNDGTRDGLFARLVAHQVAPLGDPVRANVFLATLRPGVGGVNRLNRVGLWAADRDGNVQLLVRTGDLLEVGGVEQPIRLLSALRVVPGTRGVGRGTSETGKVVCLAGLPRGRQALVIVEMP